MHKQEREARRHLLREIGSLTLARLDSLPETSDKEEPKNCLEGAIAKLKLTEKISPLMEGFFNFSNVPLRFGLFSGIFYPPIMYHSEDTRNKLVYVASTEEKPEELTEITLRKLARGKNVSAVESIGSLSPAEFIDKFKKHISSNTQ